MRTYAQRWYHDDKQSARTWNIISAECHSLRTLTQVEPSDHPTANKATFTQYGVIILDSLLKADLSEPAVYKPRGPEDNQSAIQNWRGGEKNKQTAVGYEISASNKIGHGVQRGNHNMLEEGGDDSDRH